jgi:hypothetical protein
VRQRYLDPLIPARAVDYQHLTFEVEGDVTYLADRNGRSLRQERSVHYLSSLQCIYFLL